MISGKVLLHDSETGKDYVIDVEEFTWLEQVSYTRYLNGKRRYKIEAISRDEVHFNDG